jgi:nucleotide-binding universal stress UspA family protein
MAYKSFLTIWDGRDEARAALDLAVSMTRDANGHLTVLCLGIDRIQPGLYYAGATPAIMTESIDAAREAAIEADKAAKAALESSGINWSTQAMVAQLSGISYVVGQAARFADLVILPRPYGGDAGEESAFSLEAAMFEGHAPVLVCPSAVSATPGNRIVIAWNESAEAMAAIKAALPMIVSAEAVDVAIVDPGRGYSDQGDPGIELSQMLSRHGAKVTVTVLPRTVPRVAEVLQRHATDFNADMIVMGAYGHSRFRESILGGATRDMLEDVSLPVLMAR